MNAPLISPIESDPRRHLASIDELIQMPVAHELIAEYGRARVLKVLKTVLQEKREEIELTLKTSPGESSSSQALAKVASSATPPSTVNTRLKVSQ